MTALLGILRIMMSSRPTPLRAYAVFSFLPGDGRVTQSNMRDVKGEVC